MNYEPFYLQLKEMEGVSKSTAYIYIKAIESNFKYEDFQNIDSVCRLFYGNSTSISKAQYYKIRKVIVPFYAWLLEQGKITKDFYDKVASLKIDDIITETELNQYYYKDLDSILNYIKQVGAVKGLGGDDDLLNIKTIAILSWYLVDINEMVLIKREDVDFKNYKIIIRGKHERTVRILKKYFDVIEKFVHIDNQRGFPSGKMQYYLPSKYLFRSSKNEQMNANNINCALKRFNSEAVKFGQTINLTPLKVNSICYNVLKEELNGNTQTVNSIIEDMLDCDRSLAFGYAQFYKRWKARYGEACH